MALIHHNELRVNVPAPEDADQMAVYYESGWRKGPHKDTDPDDPSAVPAVLPVADPEPEPPAKAKAKADPKES